MRNAIRTQTDRARLGVKLAYGLDAKSKSKKSHLPGPFFDVFAVGTLLVLGGSYTVTQLVASLIR